MNSLTISKTRAGGKKRKQLWWVFGLVILLGGAAAYFLLGAPGSPFAVQSTAQAAQESYTAVVRRGDIQISASGSGTLTAFQTVDLHFSAPGTVTALNVQPGDQVKAGQVLARLDGGQNLQAAVTADQLSLLQAQQSLAQMQQNANVSLAQAYQSLVKAQQTYNDALKTQQRTDYARCSKETNVQNAAKLDAARQKLDDLTSKDYGSDLWTNAKNNYDQALANYNYCHGYTQDEKVSAQSALDVAKVTMQQAEASYNTLKNNAGIDPSQLALAEAKVKQAQTQLDQDQHNLQGIELVAPFDGIVTYLAAGQDAIVDTAKYITVADTSRPTVQISVDETDINKLKTGSPAEITFDALPNQVFHGKVTRVEPQLVKSGQYQVAQALVELDANAAARLKGLPLGLNASVTVIDQQASGALLVPVQALRDLGNGEYAVFITGAGGQLRFTPVKVGIQDAAHAEILDGLRAGDVVSTGNAQVK